MGPVGPTVLVAGESATVSSDKSQDREAIQDSCICRAKKRDRRVERFRDNVSEVIIFHARLISSVVGMNEKGHVEVFSCFKERNIPRVVEGDETHAGADLGAD